MTKAKNRDYKIEISPLIFDELIKGDYLKERLEVESDPLFAIFDWHQKVKLETHGLIPEIRKATFNSSKKALEDLIFIDQQDINLILRCINVSFTDNFWKDNIFSIRSLRKNCKDGVSRYTKLLMIYNNQKKTEKPSEVKFGRIKLL